MLCGNIFDYDRRVSHLEALDARAAQPDFWQEPKQAQKSLQEASRLKWWVKAYDELNETFDTLEVLRELYNEGEASQEEVLSHQENAKQALENLEFKRMLRKEEDSNSALLELNPGAGGTESQDWAQLLLRMYVMWAEAHQYKVCILDEHPGDTAGIKAATLEITGPYAYGYLKAEVGVHRLVRISPFDSSARRHTSFASVGVYPITDDRIEININPADLSWETFRAAGAGGQHVNKVETAVRVRHAPSGLVVACQQERSQLQNKEKALHMLQAKLYAIELEKQHQARLEVEKNKMRIDFGSQIRSYVLHPYKMVKDNRTSFQLNDVQKVLDGDIDPFIKAYLLAGD